MNRVDHMIKYLSGDLDREESTAFEKQLAQDKRLRDTFDHVSAAYNLVGDQLKKRDEAAFREALREVMDQSEPREAKGPKNRRPRWVILLPMAASFAILLAILVVNRGSARIYQDFFNPLEDPVILAYNQETRGDADSAITLFGLGQFEASLEKTSKMLLNDPGNQLVLLFHLLAAMELNLEASVLPTLDTMSFDTRHVLGQSLSWYHALAMVKTGQTSEAVSLLERVLLQPGPYDSDAHKLQKMLTK